VRFKYQLEGFDNDWVEAARAVAYYANLPAGSYRFPTSSPATNDGLWNEAGDAFAFTSRPFLPARLVFTHSVAGVGRADRRHL